MCQKSVLHRFQARCRLVYPLDEVRKLLGACLDGLRLDTSSLRDILHQSSLPAWLAVAVVATDSLVPAKPVAVGPERSGPLDVVDQAVAVRHLHSSPIGREKHSRQIAVKES